jgi:hypothetical protein
VTVSVPMAGMPKAKLQTPKVNCHYRRCGQVKRVTPSEGSVC